MKVSDNNGDKNDSRKRPEQKSDEYNRDDLTGFANERPEKRSEYLRYDADYGIEFIIHATLAHEPVGADEIRKGRKAKQNNIGKKLLNVSRNIPA